MYATHSIHYENLKSYFYGFSVWDEYNVALSTEEQWHFFHDLGIVQPETFYKGIFDVKVLEDLAKSLDPETQEGFVVRVTSEIPFNDFHKLVAKWVRKGHVQTNSHWMSQRVVPNIVKLA
jgi:spore coat polysaccharide biosynthesis protein SpsF (cytidylyltransferase family)